MPITQQVLPAEELNALRTGLPSFKSVDSATAALLLQAAQNATLGHTTEVFTMGVADVLTGGGGLGAATSSGWRLSADLSGKRIACDMYTVARGGAQPLSQGSRRLSVIRTGGPVNKLLHAIAGLTQIDGQPPGTPFAIQLLVMPALFTDAIWLLPSSLNVADSRLVAYDTLIKSFTPGTQYTEADFLTHLAPVAQYWQNRPPRTHRR